jgi:hypothetical protein
MVNNQGDNQRNSHPVAQRSSTIYPDVVNFHERFGHMSKKNMIACCDPNGSILNSDLSPSKIISTFNNWSCLFCAAGKRNSPSIPKNLSPPIDVIGHTISTDVLPKISPVSIHGEYNAFVFCCVFTGFLHGYVSSTKTDFLSFLSSVVDFYKFHGHTVKILRTDSENVLMSESVMEYLYANRIQMQNSAPYAHYQNAAERQIQTIIKGVSTILHSSTMVNANLWSYAYLHFINTRNSTPNIHTAPATPLFLATGERTDAASTFLYAFGQPLCYPLQPNEKFIKFDTRNDIGYYVGQPTSSVHACLIYCPYSHAVKCRTGASPIAATAIDIDRWRGLREHVSSRERSHAHLRQFMEDIQSRNIDLGGVASSPPPTSTSSVPFPSQPIYGTQTRRRTRSQTPHALAIARSDDNPTLRKALNSANAERDNWLTTLRKEYNQLFESTLAPISYEEINSLSSCEFLHMTTKLVRKHNAADPSIIKYKARGCGDGSVFRNIWNDNFSPTVNSVTLSIIQNYSFLRNFKEYVVDTVGAYLYQEYPLTKTPLIVTLEPLVVEALGLQPSQKYRLKKYIYGLPDSGQAYFNAYSTLLASNEYIQSSLDPCLFFKIKDDSVIYLCFHVDDTYICTNDELLFNEFITCVSTIFEITISYNLECYIGIKQAYCQDVKIQSQPKLLTSLFEKCNTKNNNTVKTPLPSPSGKPRNEQPVDRTLFLSILGSLIYLTRTRLDIAFSVSWLASKASAPTVSDHSDLLHVVQYTFQTQHHGLVFRRVPDGQPLQLVCYADASWLNYPDSRSQTAYTISFNNCGTFYGKSSKQTGVATSSTESEINALFTLIQELVYIDALCENIGVILIHPVLVYEDNEAAITLTTQLSSKNNHSKHYLHKINFCRQHVESGFIKLIKIDTILNNADLLSKALYARDFQYKAQAVQGVQPGEELLTPPAK